MSEQFYACTTWAGELAVLNASASGQQDIWAELAVGDGGGSYYEPQKEQAALVHEVWRGAAQVELVEGDPNRILVTGFIPSDAGSFLIREAGVFNRAGQLMAVAKLPLSAKVDAGSGAAKDISVRFYVQIAGISGAVVTVEPSLQYVSMARFLETVAQLTAWQQQQDERLEGYAAQLAALTAVQADHEARIRALEDMLLNDITANPWRIRFNTLDGLTVSGVWNVSQQRLEC